MLGRYRYPLSLLLVLSRVSMLAQRTETRPVPPATFLTAPFEGVTQTLAPHFMGHDAREIFLALLPKAQELKKSGFETQSAFEQRLRLFESKPILLRGCVL